MLVGPFFQYIAMILFPSSAEVRKGRALLKKTVENIIEDHVKTFNPSHLRDYVDVYLDQRRKLEKNEELQASSFTMDRLRAISMNMMMEGTESVTSALTTLLTAISKHPVEQKLAQEELDTVVGKERLPSWLDRQNLPYLEAMIQELYRT
ncbi:Cytochrome P450 1A1, partial [Stegodyphus mimosarum]